MQPDFAEQSARGNAMTYTFTVPLVPKGAGRPRFARLSTGQVRTYQPSDLTNWKAAVATCAASALAGVSFTGPTEVVIVAVMPRPKELLRVHGRGPMKGAPVHGAGRIWCATKPDRDNVDKGILDALKPWMPNDAVVCCGEVLKVYAAMNENPHLEIRIQPAPLIDQHLVGLGLPLPYDAQLPGGITLSPMRRWTETVLPVVSEWEDHERHYEEFKAAAEQAPMPLPVQVVTREQAQEKGTEVKP